MTSLLRSAGLALLGAFAVVVTVVLVRTITVSVRNDDVMECKPYDSDFIQADSGLVERFRLALQFRTVTQETGHSSHEELTKFRKFVEEGNLQQLK